MEDTRTDVLERQNDGKDSKSSDEERIGGSGRMARVSGKSEQ